MKNSKLIPVHQVQDKLMYNTEVTITLEELTALYSILNDYVDAHKDSHHTEVEFEANLSHKINVLLGLMRMNDS